MPTTGSLGPKGVRVNGVALGADLDTLAGERWSDGGEAETIRKPDTARPPGQPVELLSIYVQLAANDASYANGNIYGSSGAAGSPSGATFRKA